MDEIKPTEEFERWSKIVSTLSSSARWKIQRVKENIEKGHVVHAFGKAVYGGKRSIDCLNILDSIDSLRFDDLDIYQLASLVHENSTNDATFDDLTVLHPRYQNNLAQVGKLLEKNIPLKAIVGASLVKGVSDFSTYVFGTSGTLGNLAFLIGCVAAAYLYLNDEKVYKELIDSGQAADFEKAVIQAITCELLEKKSNETAALKAIGVRSMG